MGTRQSLGDTVSRGEPEGQEPPGTTFRSFPQHCRRGSTQADSSTPQGPEVLWLTRAEPMV